MTIGTGVFSPQGQFSVQRSFIQVVAIDGIFLPVATLGPNFEFHPTAGPTQHYFISFLPEFWAWSSNSYTLDHIVTEAYYTFPPSPIQFPFNYELRYFPPTPSENGGVFFVFPTFGLPPAIYSMPPRTLPYWLPDL